MNDYVERIKKMKEERIRLDIKEIEETILKLMPWDYVVCKDGVPRIGTRLIWRLGESVKVFPTIREYYEEQGFAFEEVKGSFIVIYIKDEKPQIYSRIYYDVCFNLKKYAYVKWPSNWPREVSDMLEGKIDIYNSQDDIKMLLKDISEGLFEDVKSSIPVITNLYRIYHTENGKLEYDIGKESCKESCRSQAFFEKQGFYFDDKDDTLKVREENRESNNVVRYCHERICNQIAKEIIDLAEKSNSLFVKFYIKDSLPESVRVMLKKDGIIAQTKFPDPFNEEETETEISLV